MLFKNEKTSKFGSLIILIMIISRFCYLSFVLLFFYSLKIICQTKLNYMRQCVFNNAIRVAISQKSRENFLSFGSHFLFVSSIYCFNFNGIMK